MAFNIQGAVQYLTARAHAKSEGWCARYVRQAIEAGGISTAGRPNWAWKYIQYLPTIGFQHIGTCNNRQSQAMFPARAGDIAVYTKPGFGTSKPGHICMFNGSQWISDFRQSRMGVYAGEVGAHIFRYTGEISNSPIDMGVFGLSGGGLGDFSGGFNNGGLVELNGETLASRCPEDVELKGMWSRYQLMLGEHSPIIQEYMSNISNDSFGDGSFNLTELAGSDAVEKAMRLIAFEECGQDFDSPLPQKMLVGYQLKGEGSKTYGFGQVYNWNGTKRLQDIKPVWTEQELREDFRKMVAKEVAAAKSIGLPFTDNQLAVLAHRYHFGPAAFKDLSRRIKALGRIPSAVEYRDMALTYCKSCSNWNLYGKGWTNGVNREAAHWST